MIALDGSEHFCSRKISCPHCSTRRRSDGATEFFHSFVGAAVVAPGQAGAFALPPEFIRSQDGAAKQDCEPLAARCWIERFGQAYGFLRPVVLGDDLYAHQPICAAIQAAGANFILVCKPASHKIIGEYLTGVDLETHRHTQGVGSTKRIHTYRFMNGVPLRDGKDALPVNWVEITITKPDGKVTYRSSFITDLPVSQNAVAELGLDPVSLTVSGLVRVGS